jgi:hypothetical protein
MFSAKLVGVVVAVCGVVSLCACGSSAGGGSAPTTASATTVQTSAPGSTAGGNAVHVMVHMTGTGSLAGIFNHAPFDAPPLGSGTWSGQAIDPSCNCAQIVLSFQAGDQLSGTITFTLLSQSSPPPPAVGGSNHFDQVFTVKSGTGRFAAAGGALRGSGTFIVVTSDPGTNSGTGTTDASLVGDISMVH